MGTEQRSNAADRLVSWASPVVDAAAVPTSVMAALQALRDIAKVRPGWTVLVMGAWSRPDRSPRSPTAPIPDEAADALRYYGAGHIRGKVVVTV